MNNEKITSENIQWNNRTAEPATPSLEELIPKDYLDGVFNAEGDFHK